MTERSIVERLLAGEDVPQAELDADRDRGHAEKYPDGCRSAGHMCERCATRLGDEPHRYVKVGARPGYRGRWVCDVPACPYYRT